MSGFSAVFLKLVDFSIIDPKTATLDDIRTFLTPIMIGYEKHEYSVDGDGHIKSFTYTRLDESTDPAQQKTLRIEKWDDLIGGYGYRITVKTHSPDYLDKIWGRYTFEDITVSDMAGLLHQLDWLFNVHQFDPTLIYKED